MRKLEQDMLERTEIKMLRWIMGIKRIEMSGQTIMCNQQT